MSKTIEDRAYEHYPIDLQKSNDMEVSLKNDWGWDGYVLGATEQREFDINFICQWLKKNLPITDIKDGEEIDLTTTSLNVISPDNLEEIITEITKAMRN